MINNNQIITITRLGNIVGLCGILLVVCTTLSIQFIYHDLPCPLCLLQRLAFFGMALGFIMNLRFNFRASHYTIILLSGFLASFIALRQIVLHIIPGTGSYGAAIFGMHLYTWSYVGSIMTMVLTAILLSFDRQYQSINGNVNQEGNGWRKLTQFLFVVFMLVLLVNTISTFLLCGFKMMCAEDPITYGLLNHNS